MFGFRLSAFDGFGLLFILSALQFRQCGVCVGGAPQVFPHLRARRPEFAARYFFRVDSDFAAVVAAFLADGAGGFAAAFADYKQLASGSGCRCGMPQRIRRRVRDNNRG